jgi:hypothetical protein
VAAAAQVVAAKGALGRPWMRSVNVPLPRAASFTTTSTTRLTCCAPWPRPPATRCWMPSGTCSLASAPGRAWSDGLMPWPGCGRNEVGKEAAPLPNSSASSVNATTASGACSPLGSTTGRPASAAGWPPWPPQLSCGLH